VDKRRLLAVFGTMATLLGLGLLAASSYSIGRLERDARSVDEKIERRGSPAPSCALISVSAPTRTPYVGETMALVLTFSNTQSGRCNIKVWIDAPGFEKDQSSPREYAVPPGESERHVSLLAKQPGRHSISLSSEDVSIDVGLNVLSNDLFGPRVTSALGLIATFLGPVGTLPFWIEVYRNRRRKSESSQKSEAKPNA
jgi:hypothetical protein